MRLAEHQERQRQIFMAFYNYCDLQGLSTGTVKSIKFSINLLAKNITNTLEISDNELFNFFCQGKNGELTGQIWSPAHYNNIRKYLKKFYKWCLEYGHIQRNPIEKIPVTKVPRRLPRRLTEEDKIKALYHAQNFPHPSKFLRARNYAIVATFIITGLRASELLKLHNEDINLKEFSIRVREGKGGKERIVYFNNDLLYILKDYLAERERIKKESLYFFVSYGSTKRLTYTNLRRMLKKIGNKAGIHFTAHQLRHTSFSLMAEQGTDLETIKQQAGHTSIGTTQIYLHASPKHIQSAISKVSFL